MSGSDVGKLTAVAVFAGLTFAAGFLLGKAREDHLWQRAAIDNHAAIFRKDRYTGAWVFQWTPAPYGQEEKR